MQAWCIKSEFIYLSFTLKLVTALNVSNILYVQSRSIVFPTKEVEVQYLGNPE